MPEGPFRKRLGIHKIILVKILPVHLRGRRTSPHVENRVDFTIQPPFAGLFQQVVFFKIVSDRTLVPIHRLRGLIAVFVHQKNVLPAQSIKLPDQTTSNKSRTPRHNDHVKFSAPVLLF